MDDFEQPNLTSQVAFEQGVGSGNLQRVLQTKIIVRLHEALKRYFANSSFLVFHFHFIYMSANCSHSILQVPLLHKKRILMNHVKVPFMRIQNKMCQSAGAFIF